MNGGQTSRREIRSEERATDPNRSSASPDRRAPARHRGSGRPEPDLDARSGDVIDRVLERSRAGRREEVAVVVPSFLFLTFPPTREGRPGAISHIFVDVAIVEVRVVGVDKLLTQPIEPIGVELRLEG